MTLAEEKKGVELLKKAIAIVVSDIKLGTEIAKDGVNAADLVHVPAVIDAVKAILDMASHSAEAIAEAKDIDMSEAGELVLAAITGIKELSQKVEA